MSRPLPSPPSQTLTTYTDPHHLHRPSPPTQTLTTYTYPHFVDDGVGDFNDIPPTDGFLKFLNSLTDDLQFTIEYPSEDGALPYMDILIHADKSTSVYRKPTHSNNCCAPSS